MSRSQSICRFAYKPKSKGLVVDRSHRCKASCQWTADDCIAWLNRTPYPTATIPPVQIEHGPCAQGVSYAAHLKPHTARNGSLGGIKFTDCEGHGCVCPKRHLLSCDCLDCVSERITADLRERIPA